MDPLFLNKYIEKQREYIFDLLNKNIMLEARIAVLEAKLQEQVVAEQQLKTPDT